MELIATQRGLGYYIYLQGSTLFNYPKELQHLEALRENGIFKSPGKTYPCLALSEADFDLTDAAIAKAAAAIS